MVDRNILSRQGLRALGELLFAAQTSHHGQGCLETWIHSRSRSHIRKELHYARNLNMRKPFTKNLTSFYHPLGRCQFRVTRILSLK